MDIQTLTQYAQLATTFGATTEDPMLESIADSIAARSAQTKADAVTAFTDAGVDYRDFMPASKRALRAKREELKLEQDRLDREAQREYENAMREQRLLQERAATAMAEQAARNTGAAI